MRLPFSQGQPERCTAHRARNTLWQLNWKSGNWLKSAAAQNPCSQVPNHKCEPPPFMPTGQRKFIKTISSKLKRALQQPKTAQICIFKQKMDDSHQVTKQPGETRPTQLFLSAGPDALLLNHTVTRWREKRSLPVSRRSPSHPAPGEHKELSQRRDRRAGRARGRPVPPGEGLGPPPAPPNLRGRTLEAAGMDPVTPQVQLRFARVFPGSVQRNLPAGRHAPLPLLSRSPCPDPAPGPAAHAVSCSAPSAPPAPLEAPASLLGSASLPPPRSAPGPLPTPPPPPHSQGPGLPVVFHDGGRAPLSAAAPGGSAGGARRRTEAKGR